MNHGSPGPDDELRPDEPYGPDAHGGSGSTIQGEVVQRSSPQVWRSPQSGDAGSGTPGAPGVDARLPQTAQPWGPTPQADGGFAGYPTEAGGAYPAQGELTPGQDGGYPAYGAYGGYGAGPQGGYAQQPGGQSAAPQNALPGGHLTPRPGDPSAASGWGGPVPSGPQGAPGDGGDFTLPDPGQADPRQADPRQADPRQAGPGQGQVHGQLPAPGAAPAGFGAPMGGESTQAIPRAQAGHGFDAAPTQALPPQNAAAPTQALPPQGGTPYGAPYGAPPVEENPATQVMPPQSLPGWDTPAERGYGNEGFLGRQGFGRGGQAPPPDQGYGQGYGQYPGGQYPGGQNPGAAGYGYPAQPPGPGPGAGLRMEEDYPPARRRLSPVAIGAIVVAACVVVGVGAAALLSGGGGSADAASSASASASAGSGQGAGSTGGSAGKSQAQALSDLLGTASDSRAEVVNAVASIKGCKNLDQSAAALKDAASQRHQLIDKLDALSVGQLTSGQQLASMLRSSWQASADADSHYANWGLQSKDECSKKHRPRPGGELTRGDQKSYQATADKQRAAQLWNTLAGQYGLPQRSATRL